MKFSFETLIVGQQGVRRLLERGEFLLEIFHVTFLSFAESALSANQLGQESLKITRTAVAYAALFCAFRRDCAGVSVSFSSLLLRPGRSFSPSKITLPPPIDGLCSGPGRLISGVKVLGSYCGTNVS